MSKNGKVILQRDPDVVSRAMEFFTERQLQMQIGADRADWVIVLLKELIDNSLDACEQHGTPPRVVVKNAGTSFMVRDDGPGIPPGVIERSLDYTVRVSQKMFNVSPTRGQLGNALKCLWAAPFVVSGGRRGLIEVETKEVLHRIKVTFDRIAQEPRVEHTTHPSFVKTGTILRFHWPDVAS